MTRPRGISCVENGERVYEKTPVGARNTVSGAQILGNASRRHMSDRMRDERTAPGFSVSPKDITVVWEDNGRAFPYTPEDIQDLLQDFEEGKGVQQPIVVKPWKTEGNSKGLKILAGFRRLYAGLEELKKNPEFLIPVIIEEPGDALEELILNIRENVARKDLSHIDLGKNAQRLTSQGMTIEEAGKVLGVSAAQVTQQAPLQLHFPLVTPRPFLVQRLL